MAAETLPRVPEGDKWPVEQSQNGQGWATVSRPWLRWFSVIQQILKNVSPYPDNAPVTNSAATYQVLNGTKYLINTVASTLTLLPASSNIGRELTVSTTGVNAIISVASNVVPITGGAAGTAILAATAGKWATLVSNGTNWVIMAQN